MCDLCSQRRGIEEGIFRCHKCAPDNTLVANDPVDDTFVDAVTDDVFADSEDVPIETKIAEAEASAAEVEQSNDADVVEESAVADTEEEAFDWRVQERPKRLNKKMGRNSIVSVILKNILPVNAIKDKYPNNYKQKRCNFIVGGIKSTQVKTRKGDEVIIVVELRFKNPKEDPRFEDGLDELFYWSAMFANCRLEKAGPPNQIFLS